MNFHDGGVQQYCLEFHAHQLFALPFLEGRIQSMETAYSMQFEAYDAWE